MTDFGPFPFLHNHALMAHDRSVKPWLWKGFLAPGETTLLTSLWKSGKSTLISVLLSKMRSGGELAGMPVAPCNVAIVTEEPAEKWAERGRQLIFGDNFFWFCRPFKGKPTHDDWLALIDQIARMYDRFRLDLVIFDTFSNLAPVRSENDSAEMLKAVLPLQKLTDRKIGNLIAHHPRKGAIVPGQAARGSGALSGFVDMIIEMQHVSAGHAKDRRRSLRAFSRHDDTPTTTVIELSADGKDYHLLAPNAELDYERGWLVIKDILEHAEIDGYRTLRDFVREWPEGFAPPNGRTLRKWVTRAVDENRLLNHHGEGTKRDPHRYCLPGQPEQWQQQWLEDFRSRPVDPEYLARAAAAREHADRYAAKLASQEPTQPSQDSGANEQPDLSCKAPEKKGAKSEVANTMAPIAPFPEPQSTQREYFESQVRGAQALIETLAKMDAERLAAEKARTATATPPATEAPTP